MRSLPIGTVVSYQDTANPRQEAIVTQEPNFSGSWQEVVFEDGRPSQIFPRSIEGPGGWSLVGRVATAEEVLEARGKVKVWREQHAKRQAEINARTIEAEKRVRESAPEWAKSVIIAEYEIDQSDFYTDYYGHVVERVILLAWSKHERRVFPEMRKAALNSDITEIRALADAPQSAEHRENYSMGGGTYLKDGSRHAAGWTIRKCPIQYINHSRLDLGSPILARDLK